MASDGETGIDGVPLTRREQVVLTGILDRASNEQIAAQLGCSVKTVEFHVGNMLRKTGEKSRLGLALAALGKR